MLDHLTYTAPEPKVIQGAKQDWELVIGLEVHAQVASNAGLNEATTRRSRPTVVHELPCMLVPSL